MHLSEWRFCPRCATPLIHRQHHGTVRPICDACNFIHFADPKVTVAVLIIDDGRILLGKRAVNPGMGLWCLPGGFVDHGELVREAAAREVREETALTVEIGPLLEVDDWSDEESGKKGVVLFFEAYLDKRSRQKPMASDDMLELRWCSYDQLPPIAFPSHEKMVLNLKHALAHHK